MGELTKIILIGTIAGVFGTGIGGMIIAFLGRPRGNMLCFLLTFSSGIMIAVVFHDLIPEAELHTSRDCLRCRWSLSFEQVYTPRPSTSTERRRPAPPLHCPPNANWYVAGTGDCYA